MDSGLKKASEHGTCQAGRGEDTAAFPELSSCVPRTEDVVRPDECRGFGDALEEADCHYVAGMVDGGCDHGEGTPDEHHTGEEDAGFEMVEGEIGRNLADDIARTY